VLRFGLAAWLTVLEHRGSSVSQCDHALKRTKGDKTIVGREGEVESNDGALDESRARAVRVDEA
jgi:hypothetical protein